MTLYVVSECCVSAGRVGKKTSTKQATCPMRVSGSVGQRSDIPQLNNEPPQDTMPSTVCRVCHYTVLCRAVNNNTKTLLLLLSIPYCHIYLTASVLSIYCEYLPYLHVPTRPVRYNRVIHSASSDSSDLTGNLIQ